MYLKTVRSITLSCTMQTPDSWFCLFYTFPNKVTAYVRSTCIVYESRYTCTCRYTLSEPLEFCMILRQTYERGNEYGGIRLEFLAIYTGGEFCNREIENRHGKT